MMVLAVTLPPESRPGVRVDQATARLNRAQKLKAELEEKLSLLEVEQAAQDNLTEIAAATAELENAKRALIPSAPTTDPGSACITFSSSRQNSKGFCSRVRKAWPQIQKKRKEQNGAATKATRLLESPRRPHKRR